MTGKIPQNFIDDVLDRTDIVELIDSRVKLKKTGRNYSACCPFHQEKTPSFSVNPDKQFYYCFGCGAGGNAISFLMDYDRSSFVETVESLARNLGMEIPREQNDSTAPARNNKSLYDILSLSNDYYQQQLRQHPHKNKAIDYLKQRGLTGEIAKAFGIGYAPPGWDNLLKALGGSPQQKSMLMESGMLIEKEDHSGSYDRFRDRLMFPIRDSRGRIIGFGGRVLNDEKPKYLNSPETPVFHKQQELYGLYEARQANRHLERLLMVEGYMDVVAMAQYGITWAVATLGTSAGTAHMEKVFRHCQEVIFCFDGDAAGRKAAFRALEAVLPLMKSGRQAKFLFLPEGEDPDSLVRKIGTDKFLWHIDHAQTLSEYLFAMHGEGLDLGRADDKARLINDIMPHIHMLPAGALQELLWRSLSEKTGLPIDDIKALDKEQIDKPPTTQPARQKQETVDSAARRDHLPRDSRKPRRTPARMALSLLTLYPELASEKDLTILHQIPSPDEDTRMLMELIKVILARPSITPAQLIGYWQSYNKSALHHFLGLELAGNDEEIHRLEYQETMEKIRGQRQREIHAEIIEKNKYNGTLKIEDLSTEEREAFLSIFKNNTN